MHCVWCEKCGPVLRDIQVGCSFLCTAMALLCRLQVGGGLMRIVCCVSNSGVDKHGILLGMTLLCAAWCVFYGLLVCGGILGTTLISSSCVEPQSLPLTRSFTNHSCPPLPSPAHPTPCNCTHMLPSTRTLSTSLPAVNSPSFIWAASLAFTHPLLPLPPPRNAMRAGYHPHGHAQ